MASDSVFGMFPEPSGTPAKDSGCDAERFVQKKYPMLHMNLTGCEHPSIEGVSYCDAPGRPCPVCALDCNILDSLRVLKPHEIKDYLVSHGHRFTDEQVNVHLSHSAREDNLIGVIQNMSVDLMSKSYSLASNASLRVMNSIRTHMGRTFFVADPDVAKVHNDAVKQFVSLAATCQALMKNKSGDSDKGSTGGLL